jgi:hypothetical protein
VIAFATDVMPWKEAREGQPAEQVQRGGTGLPSRAIGGSSKEDLASVGCGLGQPRGGKTNSYGALMTALAR